MQKLKKLKKKASHLTLKNMAEIEEPLSKTKCGYGRRKRTTQALVMEINGAWWFLPVFHVYTAQS